MSIERHAAYLAVIKCTAYRKVMNIRVGDRGHLRLLNGRNATFWMQYEDRDVGFIPKSIDGSTTTPSQ